MAGLKNRKKALTLVEIMISVVIFLILAYLVSSTYFSGLDFWEVSRDQIDLQAQARIALDFMTAELRNATRTSTQNPSPNLSIPSTPNNKSIIFYRPLTDLNGVVLTGSDGDIRWGTSNPIRYQFVPGLNTLRRLGNGVQRVFAQNVAGVQFIDIDIDPALNIDELKIILSLQKLTEKKRTISAQLTSIVALRN